MTLMEHLEELRTRLFVSIGVWLVATIVAFAFQEPILAWLREPFNSYPQAELIVTKVFEAFLVSMQVAAFSGLVVASPIIGWQLWSFIEPALYQEERRYAVPFIAGTTLSFLAGMAFARYVALPFVLPIVLGFLGSQVKSLISIGNYFSTMLLYMGVFGLLFEMPVLGFLFSRLGFIDAATLRRYRRYSIVIGCILAAFVTPTADPINFAMVAVPLVVLYEITILVVRLSQRRVPVSDEATPA